MSRQNALGKSSFASCTCRCVPLAIRQVVWHSPEGYRVAIPIGVSFEFGAPFAPAPRFDLPANNVTSESLKFPVSSPFAASVRLESYIQPAKVFEGLLPQGETITFEFTVLPGVITGTGLVRMFDQDNPALSDIDLTLFKIARDGSETVVGTSGTTGATEEIRYTEPGKYRVEVTAFALPVPSVDVQVFQWGIATDGSNAVYGGLVVSPANLDLAPANGCCCKDEVTATISGLEPLVDGMHAR